MRRNKIVTAIFIILIIGILAVLGVLLSGLLLNTEQTNNNNTNIENLETNIQVDNNINPTVNNQEEVNTPILDPIIDENPNNEQETEESIVSSYYYNQLNSNAKKIYDGLKTNKQNLISGNYVIDYDTEFNTVLNTEGGMETFSQDFQSAWNAFSYDNVDLFYIDVTKVTLTSNYYDIGGIRTYTVSIGPGENSNYFSSSFNNQSQVEDATSYLENIKEQMIEQTSNDDVYTKIAKVHNWLIYFISYEESETSKDEHTIYGALRNGKAVCEGYARAFKYLMDGLNVPCVLVSGTALNSQGETETHAWNYVQINNNWYAVDVTWDDPVVIGGGEQTNDMKYRYFLKGSDNFFTDHTEDGVISELSMKFKFPTLATQDYSN